MTALLQVASNSRRIVTGIKWTGSRRNVWHANFLQIVRGVNRTNVLHISSYRCAIHSTLKSATRIPLLLRKVIRRALSVGGRRCGVDLRYATDVREYSNVY